MQLSKTTQVTAIKPDETVSNRILTAANVITFARLCLIPVSFILLLRGENVPATVLFGLTAATDFLDGMVARKTNTVTRLGQILDPVVDRLLVIAAVLGLLVVGRLPVWVVVVVLLRDLYLVAGGAFLISAHGIRIPVSYVGKVGMWFLCIGFAGLILNMPIWPGLGWTSSTYLPGFGMDSYCGFVWFLYIGLFLALLVTVVYTVRGARALATKLAHDKEVRDGGNR